MASPPLTIGLPVYNGAKYLDSALTAILAQDFGDFRLIISDNASTDSTLEICRYYEARDRRITLLCSDSNRGAMWNWRRVLAAADSTYFKWAAHDDICHPTMFRRCMDIFHRSDPSVALVYPKAAFIDETGATLPFDISSHWDSIYTHAARPHVRLTRVLFANLFGQPLYGIIKSSVLTQSLPYGLGCVAPDWIKLAEIAMLGTISEVPDVLFYLRYHKDNCTKRHSHWRDLIRWHDPHSRRALLYVPKHVAIVIEYLRAIRYLPLSPMDRVLCACTAILAPPSRAIWFATLRQTGPLRAKLHFSHVRRVAHGTRGFTDLSDQS